MSASKSQAHCDALFQEAISAICPSPDPDPKSSPFIPVVAFWLAIDILDDYKDAPEKDPVRLKAEGLRRNIETGFSMATLLSRVEGDCVMVYHIISTSVKALRKVKDRAVREYLARILLRRLRSHHDPPEVVCTCQMLNLFASLEQLVTKKEPVNC